MTDVLRFDSVPILGYERDVNGYLRIKGHVARTGVQTYRHPDGSVTREYRPPDEIFKEASLATYDGVALTDDHPPTLLNTQNTAKYQRGSVTTPGTRDNNYVKAEVLVTDEALIRKIESGQSREFSPGYLSELHRIPGITPEGEEYDTIQKNVRINHLAVVPRARGGRDMKVLMARMDSQVALAWEQNTSRPPEHMALINLDGLSLELPSEVAGPVQQYVIRRDSEVGELRENLESVQSALDEATQAREVSEGRADALDAALQAAEEAASNGAEDSEIPEGYVHLDSEEFRAAVTQRAALRQHLAPVIKDSAKLDSASDADLYIDAFTELTGAEPPEGSSMEYVSGVVDGIMAAGDIDKGADRFDSSDDGRTDHTQALAGQLRTRTRTDSAEERGVTRYRADSVKRWQAPLKTSNRRQR